MPTQEEWRQEAIRRGLIKPTPIHEAAGISALQGVSLGFADELAGAFAGQGLPEEEAREARRQATEDARSRLRRARRDRPVTSFISETGSSLVPSAAAFGGARLAGLGARSALYSTQPLVSAVHGAGSGETTAERAVGAGLGAGLGLAGTAAGEALGLGLSIAAREGLDPAARATRLAARAMREAVPNERDLARRLVSQRGMTPAAARAEARRMIDAGEGGSFTPEDLLNRAREVHSTPGGTQDMAFEMFPQGLNEARALAAVRGPGQSIVQRALAERAEGLRPATLSRAEETFIPKQTRSPAARGRRNRRAAQTQSIDKQPPLTGFQEFKQRLDVARRGQSGEAYRAAYAHKMTAQQRLEAVRRIGGEGFKANARRSAIERAEEDIIRISDQLEDLRIRDPQSARIAELGADLKDARNAMGALQEIGRDSRKAALRLNPRALDYYQRGLRHLADSAGGARTEGGRSIAGVRRTFMQTLDSIAPGLREAGEITASVRNLEKFADLGRGVFKPSKIDEIDAALRSARTTEQRDALMVGTLEAVEELIDRGEVQAITKLTRNRNWMNLLERMAGDTKKARQFRDFIETSARQVEARRFVEGGSPTARIAEDIARLTGEDELSFIGDAAQVAQGNVAPWAIRRAVETYSRLAQPGIRNPQVAAELARMYTQRATLPNMQALAQRLRDAPTSPIFLPQAQRRAARYGLGGASALRPAGQVSFADDR